MTMPTVVPGLSINPSLTLVVLIGTSKCPRDPDNFPALPEVRENVRVFRDLLIDPTLIGVPSDRVHTFLDEPNACTLAERLLDVTLAPVDTLIVYYAGHGTIAEESSDLLLTVSGTTHKARDFNALPVAAVRRAIKNSSAPKRVLIIDSCFSGRAFDFLAGPPDVMRSKIQVKGTFAIASAPPNEIARARGVDGCTAFSGQFLRALRDGIPSDQRVLTLGAIYARVKEQLGEGYPEPQRANWQDADQLSIAANRQYVPSSASALRPTLEGEDYEGRRHTQKPWRRT